VDGIVGTGNVTVYIGTQSLGTYSGGTTINATYGTTFRLEATSADPWRLYKWVHNNQDKPGTCSYTVTLNGDQSVDAVFRETCVLTVSANPAPLALDGCGFRVYGTVTVDPSPLSEDNPCAAGSGGGSGGPPAPSSGYEYRFWKGTRVALEAHDGAWYFHHWEGDIGTSDRYEYLAVFDLTSSRTVTAVFVPAQFNVYVAKPYTNADCWRATDPFRIGHAEWQVTVTADMQGQIQGLPADWEGAFCSFTYANATVLLNLLTCGGLSCEGYFESDRNPGYNVVRHFPIPFSAAVAGLTFAESLNTNPCPRDYDVLSYNCCDNIIEAGGLAQVPLPEGNNLWALCGGGSCPGKFADEIRAVPRVPH